MKTILLALSLLVPSLALASSGHGPKLDHANIDPSDVGSLQRGAKYFVNYCLGCHQAAYLRYEHIARDLELTHDLVKDNLMFTGIKIGDTLTNALPAAEAREWFGNVPPDLSLIARARGVDWLYTYLRTFYLDESRVPIGVNNLVFPGVGMPHVLADLQGLQKAVFVDEERKVDGETHTYKKFDRFEIVEPGSMSADEYDTAVRDLVNFMAYMGEPAEIERLHMGKWVIGFLILFGLLAYALKKEYWRDLH
ncbi:MAG: cytochrome c1 [Chromatiales bacterium]|nr:cytochrome c1 [Chromatiales bacterium]